MPSKNDTAKALLDRHGQTFADEVGIDLTKPTPTNLFGLLCASVLYSARIDAAIATEAARNLRRRKWRTAKAMSGSSWEQRVSALHDAGYTRYQERTSTMLGELSNFLLDRYDGDLRKLRDDTGRDPRAERTALKQVKGLGDVGVDIFFREVQRAWDELYPFADKRALAAARRLKLGSDARALAKLADGPAEFTRLVAALVRTELASDHDEVRKAAK